MEDFVSQATLYTELNLQNYVLKPTNISPSKLIQYALLELNETFQANDINVQIDNLEANYQIVADRDLLYKALLFIFKAFLKSLNKGNVIKIAISKEESKVICSFTIKDVKNLADIKSEAFEPFAEGNSENTFQTSLYYYFVKQVMELHQSKIEFNVIESNSLNINLIFNQV